MRISFIDAGLEDFLRDDLDNVIKIECTCHEEAEEWLLKHGESYGWTNTGVNQYDWDDND